MAFLQVVREKNVHLWLGPLLRQILSRAGALAHRSRRPRHLLFALCDHYEPLWDQATEAVGHGRVAAWVENYPKLASAFTDADGRHPRHSFFFPGEQYRPAFLEALGELVRRNLGEVELHLHHDGDSAEGLRHSITDYLGCFARHGHLTRDQAGRLRYGFIHGNWCLANARQDRRLCGVDNEIEVLFETGCYADFTFPSAPDESQPGVVNQIYWPAGDLSRRRAYDGAAERARVGGSRTDRLLMIQGPLALSLKRARMPVRLENGHLTGRDPAKPRRIRSWVAQNIHIAGRPEWVFVKVYTHGAPEVTARSLLGEGGRALHQELTSRYNDAHNWLLHYVTAREMFNIALAAMDGRTGSPSDYRDYRLPPPLVAG